MPAQWACHGGVRRLTRGGGGWHPSHSAAQDGRAVCQHANAENHQVLLDDAALHVVGNGHAHRPEIHGKRPRARFRHSCCTLRCEQVSAGGRLHAQLLEQLPPGALEGGHLLLIFGGYNAQGEEFGGNRVEVRVFVCIYLFVYLYVYMYVYV